MANLFPKRWCQGCKDWFYNESDTESIAIHKYCKFCIREGRNKKDKLKK